MMFSDASVGSGDVYKLRDEFFPSFVTLKMNGDEGFVV